MSWLDKSWVHLSNYTDREGQAGLKRYLNNLVVDQEYANPGYLFGGPGHLKEDRIRTLYDLTVKAMKEEPESEREHEKTWAKWEDWWSPPMHSYSAVMDNLRGFFTQHMHTPPKEWELAVSIVSTFLNIGQIIPEHSAEVKRRYIKRSANGGLPFWVSKGEWVDKGYDPNIHPELPNVVGQRSQHRGKNRPIWIVPFGQVWSELSLWIPCFEIVSPQEWTAWTDDAGLDSRFAASLRDYNWGGDYTEFDKMLPDFVIKSALEIGYGKFATPELIDFICHSRVLVPIVDLEGNVRYKISKPRPGGLCSGAQGTQLPVGTISNLLILVYCIIVSLGLRFDLDEDLISAIGDDFLVGSDTLKLDKPLIKRIALLIKRYFKMALHPEKQSLASDHAEYLKRYFHKESGKWYYFVNRVTQTMASVERRVRRSKYEGTFKYFVTLWVDDGLRRLDRCWPSDARDKIQEQLRNWDEYGGDIDLAKDGVDPRAIREAEIWYTNSKGIE